MSALSAICSGPVVTDVAGASPTVLQSALLEFMAASEDYRLGYLQESYGIAFDGYSYHGQADSTHQAPEDLLHTFVFSDFYSADRYPVEFQPFINTQWPDLCKTVQRIEQELLHEVAPDLIPLHRAGLAHMLSANFYPPVEQLCAPAQREARLSEHPDVSLFTVFPFGTDADLEYQTQDGRWAAFPETGNMVVFAGYLLQWLSNGLIPALNHRVALPRSLPASPLRSSQQPSQQSPQSSRSVQSQAERSSFAVFSLPRPGLHLTPFARPTDSEEGMSTEEYFSRYLSIWDC